MKSPGKEKFCKLYAGPYWGNGQLAAEMAGFSDPAKKAEMLLGEPEVMERIHYYRKLRSEMTIADEAWIKEIFIQIVKESEKDSDRIRALAFLQKYADSSLSSISEKGDDCGEEKKEVPVFFFDGEESAIL